MLLAKMETVIVVWRAQFASKKGFNIAGYDLLGRTGSILPSEVPVAPVS